MFSVADSINVWGNPELSSSVNSSRLPTNRHHRHAYRALFDSLNRTTDAFGRRQQLDKWLIQHGYDVAQGQQWELEMESPTKRIQNIWKDEYALVVRQSLENGYFYSSAFQQQLFQYYIVTKRLTVEAVESIHQSVTQQRNAEKTRSSGSFFFNGKGWSEKVKQLFLLH